MMLRNSMLNYILTGKKAEWILEEEFESQLAWRQVFSGGGFPAAIRCRAGDLVAVVETISSHWACAALIQLF